MKSLFILFLFFASSVFSQENYWDKLPEPIGFVNDFENILTKNEEKELNKLITDYEEKTTVEIAIVTIPSSATSEEKFNDLSLYIAKSWGVGKKIKNNGILIAISDGYSKIRIQTGKGTEQILSDQTTKEIIEKCMISHFKKGNYFQGVFSGINEIKTNINSPNIKVDLSNFNKSKDSLIALLSNETFTTLDSSNNVYWEIIKRGEQYIPLLIESLVDTTQTKIFSSIKKYYLTIGEVSYFALEEIAEFPAYLVAENFNENIDLTCGYSNILNYVFVNENKVKYQFLLRRFYLTHFFTYKEFKKDEMTPERTKFNITGKLKLR